MPDLTLVVVLLGFVPFALLATTSFAKLSIVLSLLRNAFGPSDVPPGAVVLVLAAPGGVLGFVKSWRLKRRYAAKAPAE